jgi:hypothetical protein
MTIDRSIEEPCEATSLTHGFEAERRGRPLRLGSAWARQRNVNVISKRVGNNVHVSAKNGTFFPFFPSRFCL